MKHYVIIGNGTAAVGCIEGIRLHDTDGKITVVSAENRPVYCRPLISYYLEGKTDLEKMNYRPKNFYDDNGCTVLYGRSAEAIDPEKKTVTLDDKSTLNYDSLCIATGSSAFVPPFDGLDTVENKFSFMTVDDTLALEGAINKDSRVLIVGAGLIGLKCAEGLRDRVSSITVCDLADKVLSSILDDESAALVQKHLEANGIRFMLGDSAQRFEKNIAFMKSGSEVGFDVLVLAVGVRPNVSLLKDIGGEVNRGIITDNSMQTSIDSIYAAGDCCESYDTSFGGRRILAILPNAYMQGKCAGENMAGQSADFDNAIPMNSIGFFGLHVMTAGSYFSGDGCEVYEDKSEGKIKKLFSKDNRLTGFILINDIERAGIYTSLIREQTPLDTIDYDSIKKSPSLIAFGKEYRCKKLGGVI